MTAAGAYVPAQHPHPVVAAGPADAPAVDPPAADPLLAAAQREALLQRRLDRERSARKAAEALLTDKSRELWGALVQTREAERRLQLALWATDEGIWEWRADAPRLALQGLWIDGQRTQLPDTRLGALLRRVHRQDRAPLMQCLRAHRQGTGTHIEADFRMVFAARWRWLRICGRALQRDAGGLALQIAGTIKDVTAQHADDETRQLMAHAFASTLDALVVVDAEWRIVQANDSFATLMGRSLAHLQSMPLTALVDLPGAHSRPGPWRGEAGFDAGLGQRCLEVSISPVVAPSIRHQRHIVVLRDISERRRAQQALSQMALTDALTGLANRAAINQHLQERVQRRGEAPFGVMFMDLDGFKAVNDSYGHRAGDEVLVAVANRLRQALPLPFIGRWGGDEFVLVLPDGSDDYLVRESAQLIIAAVSRPFTLGSDTAVVTPSIGAVFHPADGRDAPLLLQRADAAMYAAKARGRNGLVMYEPALDEGAQRCSRLQSLLRIDAERNAFTFVAQPKVNAAGQLTGAELLMRWTTEAYGPVSPAEFIPMAEKIGVIDLMGRHALHAAARMAAALRALGSQGTVAVNLSPQQLLRPDLERIAMRACEQHRADPAQLELELTESALLADPRQVRRTLGRLRKQGFQLALDDFGTGYSSLSHLRNLPFHKVKIDRSFVMDIEHDARARLMLKGVVQLCDSLGLGTVAEGVETDTQFELLRGVGIAEFQGFLFARPQPREQWFEALCGPPKPALDGGIWPTI